MQDDAARCRGPFGKYSFNSSPEAPPSPASYRGSGMLKVAIVFTLGCSVLVCNAILCTLPLISPLQLTLPTACIYVEAVLSVLSCTLFLLGSGFAFIEAWNLDPKAEPSFASQMQGVQEAEHTPPASPPESPSGRIKGIEIPIPDVHLLSGNSSHEDLFKHCRDLPPHANELTRITTGEKQACNHCVEASKKSARDLAYSRTRYLELGIFASTIFLCCSTLYYATSIVSLITIIHHQSIDRSIRYPQLLAAAGFAFASIILLIKIQRDSKGPWWRLKFLSPGFQTNFWNLIGSTGFIFCAYFGLLEQASWAQEQFNYSYLWGSWAFLLGSACDWYKAAHRSDDSKQLKGWKVEKSQV